jgi:membrane-associated phospholipid phosphatase
MKRVARAAAMVTLAVSTAAAQADSAGRERVVGIRDATILGGAAATSLMLIGWDRQISNSFRESSLQRNHGVRGVMDVVGVAGDPGSLLVGAGLWASGRFGGDRTRERLGLRAVEAIALSGMLTMGGKALFGRARPSEAPGAPRDFVAGRGFPDRSEFQSFPSGHATAAFAFASALDLELNRIAPEHPRWLVPLIYAVAAGTAVSRVYHDRHWASDVVMGSTIGFVSGRMVVRFHGDRR